MKTRWLNVGKEHTEGQEERLEKIFDAVDWLDIVEHKTTAMCPAMGISETIKQLNMHKVTHYAVSHECAPYGMYGIKAHYINMDVDLFVLDTGTEIIPLATHETEKEIVYS